MDSLRRDPSKLYKKLQELHIETGKLGPNEIAAWYDTFDTQTLEFLDWFQDNISSDNCLEYSETLACDELINKQLFLEDTAYDQALEQCESDHPGILDQEANELECELLEAELSYHQEELEYLTKSLCITNDKNKDLKKKHSGQMLEISNVDLHKDKAASTCLQLACVLDELNTNLGERLLTCFNIINNTHDYDTTTLSTTFNHEGNNEFVPQLEVILTDVLASLDTSNNSLNVSKSVNRSVQSHEESLLSSVFVDMEKSLYNNPEYITTFRIIADRLTHVLYQYHESAGKVEVLNAKMKQLQNLSRFGLSYDSIRYNTPSKLRNIRQKPPNIPQFVKCLINQPNMSLKSTEEAGINAKIKCFTEFESKLDDLLQYQRLTLELFACEVETFDQLDHFVAEIKEYVLKELKHCETRMEDMQLIVDDYKLYQQKPIEEKWHILGLILKLIEAEPDIDLTEALLVIRAFEDKCVDIKRKMFIVDVDFMAKELQKVETNNKVLHTFLSNKATGKPTVIPSNVYGTLRQVSDFIAFQCKIIRHDREKPRETKRKLEANKWLKLRRQLWMYFLRKPEKMEQILDEIERYVHVKRSAFLTS